jgi:hypothetical protein
MKQRNGQSKGNLQRRAIKIIPQKSTIGKVKNNQLKKPSRVASPKSPSYIPAESEQKKIQRNTASSRRLSRYIDELFNKKKP